MVYTEDKKKASRYQNANKNENSDLGKMKSMYEEKMEEQKNNYEKEIKTIRLSMSAEIESLQEMLSQTSRELMQQNHLNEELEKKFKLYYLKSDKYIKDREQKLLELQDECDRLADEYGRYDRLFSEERAKNERLEHEKQNLMKDNEFLNVLVKKQAFEISDYEQRYQGIDISKLHEHLEYYKNLLDIEKSLSRSLEINLVEIKNRFIAIKESAEGLNPTYREAVGHLKWRGNKDMELLQDVFSNYLVSPMARTDELIDQGVIKKDGVTRVKEKPRFSIVMFDDGKGPAEEAAAEKAPGEVEVSDESKGGGSKMEEIKEEKKE